MSNNKHLSRPTIFSTLWVFVTLNYLYCDLMGLMDSNLLRQYFTGTVDGLVINEPFLLAAAVLMEIPIAMVLLSRILEYKANRLANIMAGIIKTLVMLATLFMGTVTLYYLFFAVIEIATTIFIVVYAWTWAKDDSA
jgi:hypothetical protein